MRIHFSDNDCIWPRMAPFYDTLVHNGHTVSHAFDKNVPDADVWFVEYYNRILEAQIVGAINAIRDRLLAFKGKIVFYGLDDDGWSPCTGLDDAIQDRLDAWITFQLRPIGHCRPQRIADKFITIPRYVEKHAPYNEATPKKNQITFIGLLTGCYRFGGKNWRAEAMRMIDQNPFLKSHFLGGIVGYDVLTGLTPNVEYHNTFRHLVVPNISNEQNHANIEGSTLNLCIPGNTIWSYRQPFAMRSHTAVITMEGLKNDPHPWMFNDVFGDEFYYVKPDLSNFEEVCEYALTHETETAAKAKAGNALYKKYFQLLPDGAYQPHVWEMVRQKFGALGVGL